MEREILFRGKRIDNGKWVYGFYLLQSKKYPQILNGVWDRRTGSPHAYEVNPETVGQFTGLTDKNGTKIFEGDKLRMYDYEEYYDVEVEYACTGFVVYLDNGFSGGDADVTTVEWASCEYKLEITGNIHGKI